MKFFGLTKGVFAPVPFVDKYNSIVAAMVAVLTMVFGEYWYLFAAFFVFNVFDWLTGWYKSRKNKQESSVVGLAGAVKKVWYWVLVAVAFIVSWAIGKAAGSMTGVDLSFLSVIGWFTLACLTVNEARSICENLVQAGIHVPAVLVKGLKIADKLLKDRAEKAQPEIEETKTPPE